VAKLRLPRWDQPRAAVGPAEPKEVPPLCPNDGQSVSWEVETRNARFNFSIADHTAAIQP
jgi:hypothetical protein